MKKGIKFLTAFLITSVLITACKKGNETKNVTLNVTIAAGTTYSLDLSQYGDADDLAAITTQANNYTRSEINNASIIGKYIFLKDGSPKTGGNGNEVVVLKVYEPSGRGHNDVTNITINFTIL